MKIELIPPNVALSKAYIAHLRDAGEIDKIVIDGIESNFSSHLAKLDAQKQPTNPNQVPQELFWLTGDGRYLGYIKIRFELNAELREIGGHIGYEVSPKERKKGYATKALALALNVIRLRGTQDVLITCDETNIASRRVIEKNGGILEGRYIVETQKIPILKYWIKQ